MESNTSRVEAERLLGISEKLLQSRDLNGSRDFAVLAQETEPLLDGSDQILAVVDVLLAGEHRINNHNDWYAILQVDPTRSSSDSDLIKRHYRRLALLLHPDKNRFPFADHAFRLVSQAWSVLSDSVKKPLYDSELTLFSKVDLASSSKLPVRRTAATTTAADSSSLSRTFWTLCPYCYVLFEYPRVYKECCLKCQKCGKAFHAAAVDNLPPIVPGQEAYNCCWAVFPMGFVVGNLAAGGGKEAEGVSPGAPGFPNWMPPFFDGGAEKIGGDKPVKKAAAAPRPPPPAAAAAPVTGPRKRGRPRLHW